MSKIATEEGQVIDVLGDEKLIKKCVKVGRGKATPRAGAKVFVHYVGTFTSGTQFDSSRDRNEAINFTIGKGQVIKGWDHGISTMRKGERSVLTIHHSLAYGEEGKVPAIPPAATLVFDVELLSWTSYEDCSEKKNGSMMKDILVPAEMSFTKPLYESTVPLTIYSVEKYNNGEDEEEDPTDCSSLTPVFKQDVIMGDQMVSDQIELAVKTMTANETARFVIKGGNWSQYGVEGPDAKVVIAIGEFKNVKQTYEVTTTEDKIREGELRKVEGNDLYKAKKFWRAAAKYDAGLTYIEGDDAALKKVRLPLLTNLAAVQLEMQSYANAEGNCTKALEIDSKNLRALQRRTKARRLRADYEGCRADARMVLLLQPDNAAAKTELDLVAKAEIKQKKKDKATYIGMFDKLAKKAPVETKPAVEAEPDLDFKDTVPKVLYVTAASLPEAVGEYHLDTKKTVRGHPYWKRTGETNPELTVWRIFSDPHNKWKLGIDDNMKEGLGYIKSEEEHRVELMPQEMDAWVHIGNGDSWEADSVTKISLTPAEIGPSRE
eukprot:TRINITY_DN14734_c0_g1_i1.p1 TRINITY_DN14734_c0_g1~~TRINITY_DN14734_c0_g1_i1.p1  ORF type:complete len:547 (+),score=176.24 TRINITY_DN14734_c0_g1_i1:48-1688(+)